jgi:ElaB/YqjD/DUF883 family membrane-anchored ribosome-binding protein
MVDFPESTDKTISDATNAVRSTWNGAAETAKSAASAGRDIATRAVRDGATRAANAGSDAADRASGYMRDFPLSAALALLGVGLIVGWLIPRGR